MTLELLHKISKKQLPLTVTDMDEIDKLRLLNAAGHLAVLLPSLNAEKPFARVLAITNKGREARESKNGHFSGHAPNPEVRKNPREPL